MTGVLAAGGFVADTLSGATCTCATQHNFVSFVTNPSIPAGGFVAEALFVASLHLLSPHKPSLRH
jgi:hypothetical protein